MRYSTNNLWAVRRPMRLILRSVRYNAHREITRPAVVFVARNRWAKKRQRLGFAIRWAHGSGLFLLDKNQREWHLSAKGMEYLRFYKRRQD